MSEHDNETKGSHERVGHRAMGRKARLGIAAAVLLGLGALLGALGSAAYAYGGHGGWGMGGHHRHGDPEQMRERAQHMLRHFFDHIEASEDQRQQIGGIVDGVMEQVIPSAEQHRANRREFVDALLQSDVDREALAQIRASELALANTVSDQLVGALADVAEILTPEQRSELYERIDRFRH